MKNRRSRDGGSGKGGREEKREGGMNVGGAEEEKKSFSNQDNQRSTINTV